MAILLQDLRYAFRTLTKRPSFSLTTILLVAIGAGATTAIFSIVDSVLLRPLAYPDSERLVTLSRDGSSVPVPDYVDWRDGLKSFEAWGAAWTITRDLTGGGEPERLDAAQVTVGLLGMLGARALHGRLLTADDYSDGVAPVVVLSHDLWTRRWGGDSAILGKTIRLGGDPFTVVGIVDPDFIPSQALDLEGVDVYVPLDLGRSDVQTRDLFILSVVARLRSDVSYAVADDEIEAAEVAFAAAYPDFYQERDGSLFGIRMRTLMEATVGDVSGTLFMFLGSVVFMLLIACANVANLFLARGTDREHEIALRGALGAGRVRILVQLLTESVGLALVGGALGIVVAYWGIEAFKLLDPGGVPRLAEVALDFRVLAFALALAALTGIAFGIVPAASSARLGVQAALREGAIQTTGSRRRLRLRNGLVVAEVGLALVLLIGAGLLFNSFIRLRNVTTGFQPERTMTLRLDLESRYEGDEIARFSESLLARIAREPGVTAVGASWRLPFAGGRCCWRTTAQLAGGADSIITFIHPVTPQYFQALGATMLQGRAFERADGAIGSIAYEPGVERNVGATVSVIVNRSVADRFWPEGDAVGQPLELSHFAGTNLRVVGVVGDIHHWRLRDEAGLHIYVPFAPFANWIGLLDVVARYEGPAGGVASGMQRAVRQLDSDLPLGELATMEERIARSITAPRFHAALLTTFGAIAFLLAAGGIYSSMLYTVGQRRREMGIRIALGARGGDVAWLVLRHGMLLATLGIVLGVGTGLLLSRFLESLVFGITTTDTTTIAMASLFLGGVALLASYVPARRAATADPMAALRSE
jgi:putative ABC transport system permease protein